MIDSFSSVQASNDQSEEEDDELRRDDAGRKRVAVIDCLLESSSAEEDSTDDCKTIARRRCSFIRHSSFRSFVVLMLVEQCKLKRIALICH